jgi:hypothetical protein
MRKHDDSLLMPRPEDKGQRPFVEVLVGKGHSQEIALLSRGTVGVSETLKVSITKFFDRKDEQSLAELFCVQAGKDSLIFPSSDVEDLLTFWSLK